MAPEAVPIGQVLRKHFPELFMKEPQMQLMTDEVRKSLPPLRSQEDKGGDAIAHVKFFSPSSSWSWYITEASDEGDDVMMFGLVDGHERELGYVSLNELRSVRGPLGLPIERDLYWQPKPLREIAPELFVDLPSPAGQ